MRTAREGTTARAGASGFTFSYAVPVSVSVSVPVSVFDKRPPRLDDHSGTDTETGKHKKTAERSARPSHSPTGGADDAGRDRSSDPAGSGELGRYFSTRSRSVLPGLK
jgi:hypothetical protein